MRSNRGAADVVTVLAIATLCFSVLGIAVGVMQFRAYDETPLVPPWKGTADAKVSLVDSGDDTGGTTEPVPAPGDGTEVPPALPEDGDGGVKPPADAPGPGPDDGKDPLPAPEF
jgi:hypothetical protein